MTAILLISYLNYDSGGPVGLDPLQRIINLIIVAPSHNQPFLK